MFERCRGHRESEHKEMRITIPNLTDDVKCEMFNRRDDVKQLKKRETRACNSRRLSAKAPFTPRGVVTRTKAHPLGAVLDPLIKSLLCRGHYRRAVGVSL